VLLLVARKAASASFLCSVLLCLFGVGALAAAPKQSCGSARPYESGGGAALSADERANKVAGICVRAQNLLDTKQYEQARAVYARATQLDPNSNSAAVHGNLAFALQHLGQFDEAIVEYRKARKFNPSLKRIQADIALCLIGKAHKLESNGEFAGARSFYEESFKLDPNGSSASAHTDLGRLLRQQGDRQSAVQEYRRALTFDPKCERATEEIAGAYASLAMLDKTRFYYRKYIDDHPNGSDIGLVRECLGLAEIEAGYPGKQGTNGDYLASVLGTGVLVWPASAMPLKVFIADGGVVPGYRDSFRDILISSFDVWTQATGGRISWVLTENPKTADIYCDWTNMGCPNISGETKHEHTQAWDSLYASPVRKGGIAFLDHVSLNIRTIAVLDEKPIDARTVRTACLHEVGHALGIRAHSINDGDAMFVSVDFCPQSPSGRDIATLRGLYKTVDEICARSDAEAQQIK
jgi:tetratricopeptide (TPR) repeat protein